MDGGKRFIKTVKTDSWRPDAQQEVRQLIAAGWRLIDVTEKRPEDLDSKGKKPPLIYFKLEKIS